VRERALLYAACILKLRRPNLEVVMAEEVEVIKVSPAEYRRAREAALRELGLTYRELQAQARTGRFTSLRARKLWLAIGNRAADSA
jgi:hypothetical protein